MLSRKLAVILASVIVVGCPGERLPRAICLQKPVTVTAVGGCSDTGSCEALLSDGTEADLYRPAVGEIFYRPYKNRTFLEDSCR